MAGTWVEGYVLREGYLNGAPLKPLGVIKSFTADASDGSIPEETVAGVSGLLTGIEVEFDADDPPNSLTVQFKTIGGIVAATIGPIAASDLLDVSPPFDCCGGFLLTPTGNTANGAKANIICKFR